MKKIHDGFPFDADRLFDEAFYRLLDQHAEGTSYYVRWPGSRNILHAMAAQDPRLEALIVDTDGPACLLDEDRRWARFGEILAGRDGGEKT